MSPQPQHDTTAGRVYNDLRNLARRQGQPTDELFQLYLLERFLFRLANSQLDRRLVLKGGTLLAAYQLRRPTQDIDMQVQQLPGDVDTIQQLVDPVSGRSGGGARAHPSAHRLPASARPRLRRRHVRART